MRYTQLPANRPSRWYRTRTPSPKKVTSSAKTLWNHRVIQCHLINFCLKIISRIYPVDLTFPSVLQGKLFNILVKEQWTPPCPLVNHSRNNKTFKFQISDTAAAKICIHQMRVGIIVVGISFQRRNIKRSICCHNINRGKAVEYMHKNWANTFLRPVFVVTNNI